MAREWNYKFGRERNDFGISDGSFKPNQSITRGEFVSLLNKVFGFKKSATIQFKDVPKELWCYDAILSLLEREYISGYPEEHSDRIHQLVVKRRAVLLAKIFEKREKNRRATLFCQMMKFLLGKRGSFFCFVKKMDDMLTEVSNQVKKSLRGLNLRC